MSIIENEPNFNWVNQLKLLNNIQKNYCKEPMENIVIYTLYLNPHKGIDKINCDTIDLSTNSTISKENVYKLIQTKKYHNEINYKLIDILLYNIDLEPIHIQTFSKINTDLEMKNNRFIQSIPIFNEIYIPPSIFIFHSMNSIYFIFHQIESSNTKKISNQISYQNKMKHTKKVKFELPNFCKTKKHIQYYK